jgi:hypothetical protein
MNDEPALAIAASESIHGSVLIRNLYIRDRLLNADFPMGYLLLRRGRSSYQGYNYEKVKD